MTLIWIAIGAFIGWNLPQPSWAKAFQKYVTDKWEEFNKK